MHLIPMNKAPYAVMLAALVLSSLTGCGRKEITALQRKEAANLASEAQFASTVRDFARAEGLYTKAAELCPDNGEYWVVLGVTRKRLKDNSGAKKAYEKAVDAYGDAYKADDKHPEVLLHKAYVQALLGKFDDARSTLEKARKNHPDNRDIKGFVETKQLDKLINDPSFKELAI